MHVYIECDASASKYSYIALICHKCALYPSDVSKKYKRVLRKRAACVFSAEADHLYHVGGKTKQRPRIVSH